MNGVRSLAAVLLVVGAVALAGTGPLTGTAAAAANSATLTTTTVTAGNSAAVTVADDPATADPGYTAVASVDSTYDADGTDLSGTNATADAETISIDTSGAETGEYTVYVANVTTTPAGGTDLSTWANSTADQVLTVNGNETVTGTVTDGASGEALSGVEVEVDGEVADTTDASGDYDIEVVNGETVDLSAETTVDTADAGDVTIANTTAVTVAGSTTQDLVLFAEHSGSGTSERPYNVSNAYELQAMSQDLDADYQLVEDVDASGTADWNDGEGFDPVGTADDVTDPNPATMFTGSFDGQDRSITGLSINRSNELAVGLFGAASGLTVSNVSLVDLNVTGASLGDVGEITATGGLVGVSAGLDASSIDTSGSVSTGHVQGGLVGGWFDSDNPKSLELNNVSSSVDVTSNEITYASGGVVGFWRGQETIEDSRATGTVVGIGAGAGGFAGSLGHAELTNVSATGTVRPPDGKQVNRAGGLVGWLEDGNISRSAATGDVSSGDGNYAGGLIGDAAGSVSIEESYATGNVTGSSAVGGLVGTGAKEITNSSSTGTVHSNNSAGGLVGSSADLVLNSYAAGSVDGSEVGGITGNSVDEMTNVYWNESTADEAVTSGDATGATGLTPAQMFGMNATDNMDGLDYETTWLAVDDEDTYPVLGWQVDTYDLSLADDDINVEDITEATVDVTLSDGTETTATETSTYDTEDNVTVDAGTVTANTYGPDTVTATAGGRSDAAAITARDSDFNVTLDEPPSSVDAGETYEFEATVENVGNAEGTKNVALAFGGTELTNESETLAAGGTATIAVDYEIPEDAATAASVDLDASTPDDESTAGVRIDGFETVSGTLTDGATGEALSGLDIAVDGTVRDTTDANGDYEIEITNGSTVDLAATTTIEDADGDPEITATETVTVDGSTQQDLELWAELEGSGTENDRYNVSNAYELQAMSQDLDADYQLVDDVDANATEDWNDGKGFDPVGTADELTNPDTAPMFAGSLDGRNRTITGLNINRSNELFVGLFGATDSTTIRDLSLTNVDIRGASEEDVGGSTATGGLVGLSGDLTVSSVYVSGAVETGYSAGGVVGSNYGGAIDDGPILVFSDVTSEVGVTTSANNRGSASGGAIGFWGGPVTITNSRATGDVLGRGDDVGGFAGWIGTTWDEVELSTISNSSATGNVTASGGGSIGSAGGLVGTLYNAVTDSVSATGNVNSGGGDRAGGLVGDPDSVTRINSSYTTGDVTGADDVGGLVGNSADEISNSYAAGSVSGETVAGIAINSVGEMDNVYWNTSTAANAVTSGDATGATGLTPAQMTGPDAVANMAGLDYDKTWLAVDDDYPLLAWQVDSYDLSLADDEVDVNNTTEATVEVTLQDGTGTTATDTSTYSADGPNVSVDASTITGEAYGPDTVTATGGGLSDVAAITALDSDFRVALADAPASVDAGSTATFNARVENVGNAAGTENVSLVFDGAEFYNQSVTVAAGETENVTADYAIPAATETGTAALNASTRTDHATTTVATNGNETVTGRVVDGATGAALSNLTVTVDDGTSTQTAETNADGVYELSVVNNRTATVSATTTVDGAEGPEEITGTATATVAGETTVDLDLWPDLAGEGTSEQPYTISTARELAAMSQDSDANYTLVSDVNASQTDEWDGDGFTPIDFDGGTLDGDGYTITELQLANESFYTGLFANIYADSLVTNLSLENATALGVDGGSTGLLAGTSTDATIGRVRVTGTIDAGGFDTGGLVGFNSGEIRNSTANVSLEGDSQRVGGLVGRNGNGGTLSSSFAVGSVDGTGTLGGLVGDNSGTVENAYWDIDTTGQAASAGGGTPLTTANMTGLDATETMTLDFETTWAPSTDYPVHRFDEANADPVFAVRSVDLPEYVAPGEPSAFNATLENIGTANGTKTLVLSIDGTTSERSVTLAAGSNESVRSFVLLPADFTDGNYTAVVETPDDELTDSIEVRSRETLSGTVTDGATGEPLNDTPVTVDYGGGQQATVRTDSGGTYSIPVFNGTAVTVSANTTVDAVGDPRIDDSETLTVDGSETADLELWPELAGNGTEANPFEISNAHELQAIVQETGAKYTLVDDVDASETDEWTVSAFSEKRGFRPIAFGGSLDGDGHAITDMTVFGDGDAPGGYLGLFGTLNGARVSNLSLENATTDATGGSYTGLLVGSAYNGATIANVSITGTMRGNATNVGPIGGISGGAIRNVTADVDVGGNGTNVGGLVGWNLGAMADTSAAGSVSGNGSVGGLVGTNTGDIETSYAVGAVADGDGAGGLAGRTTTGATVSNAYWDIDSTGRTDSAGNATGLTTDEMTGADADSAMDLDFDGPWHVTPGYPALDEYEHAGNGTDDDPYEVGDVDELQLVANDPAATYTLTRDIDASETADWNDGAGFEPIGIDSVRQFSGSFDGAGHEITGLTSTDSEADGVGLFSESSGEITDVALSAVDIDGRRSVGGVAGGVYDGGTVRNVSVSGTVVGVTNVGALLGESVESDVRDSWTRGSVTAVGANAGGLVGRSETSTVTNAYAGANVTGNVNVGGLLGATEDGGTVSNSYATGPVDGDSGEGGLVGSAVGANGGTVEDSYWDTSATNQSTSAGGAPLTTETMTGANATEAMALDFGGSWVATAGYPRLRWEAASLSLRLDSTALEPGESTDATAVLGLADGSTVSVTGTASYSSGDPGVATVGNSTVTAGSDGTTDIVASAGGLEARVRIAVESPDSGTDGSGGTAGGGSRGGGDDDSGSGGAGGGTSGGAPPSPGSDGGPAGTDADGGVTVNTTATADSPTSIDLGEAVGDAGSGIRYERVALTLDADAEVTFGARPTAPERLPSGTPPLAPDDGGRADLALSYVEFTVLADGGDASDRVTAATVGFSVDTASLSEHGLGAEDVALYRYDADAGEWTELDTTVASRDNGRVRFEATSPGFSVFAVGPSTAVRGDSATAGAPDNASAGPQSPTENADSDPATTDSERETTAADGPGFGVGVALAALVSVALFRRRRT
ncbi:PGF-pre-PGF domain-containing protein [Haloarcula sp. S1CR25-12]|uniref:PGF-pre-PGF domain-containing protein n=1 Tax=Haloarcula saliterrae TaxID=2950534 RepID=A0ABU2FDF3_9EURY|nr:PGF-pre-PGF domain-containing protein [Haloarcula sp. S1CR25-12]MDS0260297.1 PGF-pre-PGF domain-containing protein [Haloarcula sp. S1CR25-12]